MLPLHHDPRSSSRGCMRFERVAIPSASISRLTSVTGSGRPDLNRRSQAPRACGLARLSHALVGSSTGQRKGPVVMTPGLETPQGVRDGPGVNSAGDRADASSPGNRWVPRRLERSDRAVDIVRSSQSRPLRVISGRFVRSRHRMFLGPDGRHRRVRYKRDARGAKDVRAVARFSRDRIRVAAYSVISMRVR
jgi:hypothetical protein